MPRLILAILAASPQQPDTLPRDTTRLPALEVRVTRAPEATARLPLAVGVLGAEEVRRAQLTAGLDESLSRLPGVVVLNRYNFSLDQRVSLRGAGSRANFGLRGVKVLLDGVPQTLPDGQSQLSNLDLALVDRVEVLTGSAGAVYGNSAGGVLAFSTETPTLPFQARTRVLAGSFGTSKLTQTIGTAQGRFGGMASLSRFRTDGFRQHSAALAYQFMAKVAAELDSRSSLSVHLGWAEAPRAENPGALTEAEYLARRDSAAGNNILRGADKDVDQQQLALRYRWANARGIELEGTAFGLLRDLANPLATPPPPPVTPASGTYNRIDRVVGGVRLSGSLPLRSDGSIRLTAGLDAQRMRDDRRNERSNAGAPTGEVLADQRETVTELGPFAQLHWDLGRGFLFLGAARYDRVAFRVQDRWLSDGIDNSGERIMENPSGSAGISYAATPAATLYASVSTSFESPTTTELVNTQNTTAGFNTALGPQRTVSAELGARGRIGRWIDYSVAGFVNWIRDAIIQAREVDGRAFFQNAGRVRNSGMEAGAGLAPFEGLSLRAAYSFADYRFTEYRIPLGATTDTLDGNRLAGVPRHFFRAVLGVRQGPVGIEVDQVTAGGMFGDDRNAISVAGWGVGITSVRLSGTIRFGEATLEPFGALNNVFDRKVVGSVNINGVGGRVLEPAPGRHAHVGLSVSWARR
ncbi:MAG: TonB-dependent receptor family protein [Gemmatimonadales bacterium]